MNVICKYQFNKSNCAYVLVDNGAIKLMRRGYENHNYTDILIKENEIETLRKKREAIERKIGKQAVIKGYFTILKYCFFAMSGYTLLTIFNFSLWYTIVSEVLAIIEAGVEVCGVVGIIGVVSRTIYNICERKKAKKEISNIDQKINSLTEAVNKMKQEDRIIETVINDKRTIDDQTAEQLCSIFEKGGIVGNLSETFYTTMLDSLLAKLEEDKTKGL